MAMSDEKSIKVIGPFQKAPQRAINEHCWTGAQGGTRAYLVERHSISIYMDASSNDEFTTTFGKLFQWLITFRLKN